MKNRTKELPAIDIELCCSCIVCIDSCPVDCLFLTVVPGQENKRRFPFMPDKRSCTGCGRCAADCPVDAIRMRPDDAPGA